MYLISTLCSLLLAISCSIPGDSVEIKEPEVAPLVVHVPEPEIVPQKASDCVVEWFLSQVGVRELTGNNDGKEVEAYLATTGMGKGNAWCAAFVHAGLENCGVENTITAWSPTAHNKNNVVWKQGWKKEPVAGKDVMCIYYVSKKRIGHTGFFYQMVSESTVETVEGNTAPNGTREGHGVYKMKRAINSLYSITRWE